MRVPIAASWLAGALYGIEPPNALAHHENSCERDLRDLLDRMAAAPPLDGEVQRDIADRLVEADALCEFGHDAEARRLIREAARLARRARSAPALSTTRPDQRE